MPKRDKWQDSGYAPKSKASAEKNRKEVKGWGFKTRLQKITSGTRKGLYRVLVQPTAKSRRILKRTEKNIRRLKRKR